MNLQALLVAVAAATSARADISYPGGLTIKPYNPIPSLPLDSPPQGGDTLPYGCSPPPPGPGPYLTESAGSSPTVGGLPELVPGFGGSPPPVGGHLPYGGSPSLPLPETYQSETVPAPEPFGPNPTVGNLPESNSGFGFPTPQVVDSKTYGACQDLHVSYSTQPPQIEQVSDSTVSNPSYVCPCGRVYNTGSSTPVVTDVQELPSVAGVPTQDVAHPQDYATTPNLLTTSPTDPTQVQDAALPVNPSVCSCGRVYSPGSSTSIAAEPQEPIIGTGEVPTSQVGYPPQYSAPTNLPATYPTVGVPVVLKSSYACSCGNTPVAAEPQDTVIGTGNVPTSQIGHPLQYSVPTNLPATYPTVQSVPGYTVSNPTYAWSCNPTPEPLFGAASVAAPVVSPPEYAASPSDSTLDNLPEPSTAGTEPISHIMKIPRKCDSNSVTFTVNNPDSSSSIPTQNSAYPPSSPTPLSFPSRPFYCTQQPPLFASCPAAVFYPTTIPYVYPPPYTCPAHPYTQPPVDSYPSVPSSQPVVSTTSIPSSTVTFTTTVPKNNGSNIASFTSKIVEPTFYKNVSSNVEPLSPFKLLSEAVSKIHEEASTTPSPDLQVDDTSNDDCSLPSPPVTV